MELPYAVSNVDDDLDGCVTHDGNLMDASLSRARTAPLTRLC